MKRNDNLHYSPILVIDASEREKTSVALVSSMSKPIVMGDSQRAQSLPAMIDQILSENKLLPANIKAVALVKKDGSVTAIRIGTAVANSFAWINRLPIIEIAADNIGQATKMLSAGQTGTAVRSSRPFA